MTDTIYTLQAGDYNVEITSRGVVYEGPDGYLTEILIAHGVNLLNSLMANDMQGFEWQKFKAWQNTPAGKMSMRDIVSSTYQDGRVTVEELNQ